MKNTSGRLSIKKLYLGIVAIAIVSSLILTLYLSKKNDQERAELNERVDIAVLILNNFGYGGIIHNFKNYLLRGEEQLFDNVLNRYSQIKKLVMTYNEREISTDEKNALDEVLKAASKYREQLEIVKLKKTQSDLSIVSIDALVKIDDTLALKSISLLINSLNAKKLTADKSSKNLNSTFLAFLFTLIVFLCILYFKEIIYLEKANQKLVIANEELGQFAYRTSHDLKAPLVTVKGIAQAIIEDVEDKDYEEVHSHALRVEEHVTRLETLVVDILSLARADLEFQESQQLDVELILAEVEDKLEKIYVDNSVSVEFNIGHHHALIASKTRITQVVENLVSNAIKYSDQDKKRSYVKVSTTSDQTFFFIEVEDNGLGIPVEYQDRVFRMFERFHQKHAFGSGLGMYIVKKHLDKMGGQINFTSSTSGTTFRIKLKRQPQGNS